MRAFVEGELRPHAPEWEAARSFPNDGVRRSSPSAAGSGSSTGPTPTGSPTRCCPRSSRAAGSGGLAAGVGAHIGIATPPLATFGTEAQQARWLAPAIRGEKIAALGDHRARHRLRRRRHPHARRARRRRLGRQRRQDVHHQRRARGLLRHRGAHAAGARARLAVVPGHRGRRGRHRAAAREARLARVRHRRDRVRGRRRARRRAARRGGPRLLPDRRQLPVGAAADVARRGRLDARDARARDRDPRRARRARRACATRSPSWRWRRRPAPR